jgi:hypothetical protein
MAVHADRHADDPPRQRVVMWSVSQVKIVHPLMITPFP